MNGVRVACVHIATTQILTHFEYLTTTADPRARVLAMFRELAHECSQRFEGPELTAGLRKLLEARDCALRATPVAWCQPTPTEATRVEP